MTGWYWESTTWFWQTNWLIFEIWLLVFIMLFMAVVSIFTPKPSAQQIDAGICHFQAGSEIMSISHLAVTARAKQDSALTS
jgi:hypothetical protein